MVYVADRENGRIEKFDLNGKYLGQIHGLGRVFAIKLSGGAVWASIQPFNQPFPAGGWLVKLDGRTGKLLGHLDVPPGGEHSLEVIASGEPLTGWGDRVLWFKPE